jgi:RNA polymerase sigma-70 factor (ECF subfamily)
VTSAAFLLCAPPDGDPRWSSADRTDDATRTRDNELVERIRATDTEPARAAFDTLFLAYVEPLTRFAQSYVDDFDGARELVADVFFSVWQSRTSWTPAHGAAVYLYGAVRNRALNMIRTRRRRQRWRVLVSRDNDVPGHTQFESRPDRELERRETAARVWNAIDALPEPRRQAVVLRWHHGMTVQEIAAILGTTTAAVYQLLKRSHDVLRKLLDPALE